METELKLENSRPSVDAKTEARPEEKQELRPICSNGVCSLGNWKPKH